ncbi:GIY-YIG nuclease family protein [Ramlibacter sp. 2FC]|uniref:GIY-YIG nuclease family protein n=1 Tax=Ramlibacter sp. 2FC TaxID=2502188 RepID=UPI0024C2FEA6|nr:GIY-YIG nuclease family protein [Ramlibacter sp. 2FC]
MAFSVSAGLVKVGYTLNLDDRIRQINLHKMGAATDWTICESIFCKNAGRIEVQVQRVLAKFRVDVGYGAKEGSSREVFQCGPRTAIIAMRKVVRDQALAGQ